MVGVGRVVCESSLRGGRRWVPASARTREWGGISWGRALRGNNGRGRVWMVGVGRAVPEPPLRGRAKMGPRIREDTGVGLVVCESSLRRGRRWVPASAGTTGGWSVSSRTAPTGENDVGHGVHPHPPSSRGQEPSPIKGEGICRRGTGYFHSNDMSESGDGFPPPREQREGGRLAREPLLRGRMMLGTGFTPIPRLHEGRL